MELLSQSSQGQGERKWKLFPEVQMWGGLSLIQGVTYPRWASFSRKRLSITADTQGLRKEPSAWNSGASTGSGHRACCLFPNGASFHHLPGPEGKTPPSQVQILVPCTSSHTTLLVPETRSRTALDRAGHEVSSVGSPPSCHSFQVPSLPLGPALAQPPAFGDFILTWFWPSDLLNWVSVCHLKGLKVSLLP